jgi:anti-anti-sigma regulatory factor
MNHTFDVSEETGNLALSESLTIEDADRLKEAVGEALTTATHLDIDLSAVDSIDLCCLQVLCSAHRTAVSRNKTLTILNPGDGFMESIRETGYLRHVGCAKTGGNQCLWADTTGEKAECETW